MDSDLENSNDNDEMESSESDITFGSDSDLDWVNSNDKDKMESSESDMTLSDSEWENSNEDQTELSFPGMKLVTFCKTFGLIIEKL